MATAREIRRRIRSVKNIRQITRALEAVSASKVRRAQDAVQGTRPYASRARQLLADVAALAGGETRHPLLTRREMVNSAYVLLISSDRGLCGAFNTNVSRAALDFERELGKPVSYVTIGRKGRDFLYRRGRRVVAEFTNLPARPGLLDTTPATRTLIQDFLDGKCDEVYLAYTEFRSMVSQRPVIRRLLPLAAQDLTGDLPSSGPRPAYEFEPGPAEILDGLLPRLTEMQVYVAVLESLASEHAARMVAMRNATDSATDLIFSLTLSYNKARQQGITNELLDIAGGANALEQALREAAAELRA
ncbi:MAG: ATP synthase F1 subunit gamma [Anaerolineae bacterium]|nr:ATP synthase F1 subunit gamma [Thermoflexales bacterium]MDW8407683.1 ATP synthase F1 subunit gamma [Anaerolineae bacterium]